MTASDQANVDILKRHIKGEIELQGEFPDIRTLDHPADLYAIAWARAHDVEAQSIVAAANLHVRQVVSVAGIYAYSERLIRSYAAKYAGHRAPGRSPDEVVGTEYTHEFSCDAVREGHGTRCKLVEREPGPLPSSSTSP